MKRLYTLCMFTILSTSLFLTTAAISKEHYQADHIVDLDAAYEAASYLSYHANKTSTYLQKLKAKTSKSTVSKAIRLSRVLGGKAEDLASKIEYGYGSEELLADLNEIEEVYSQVEATKRSLLRSQRSERREIQELFKRISMGFYELKIELIGTY